MNIKKNHLKLIYSLVFASLLATGTQPQDVSALQPAPPYGTGAVKGGALSWEILGRSMILNNNRSDVTSISIRDSAAILSENATTRRYAQGHRYKQLSNGERVIEESLYVEMAWGGMGWTNNQFRVTPANFNRNKTVKGRSLLDNLYLEEGGKHVDRIDAQLANPSHAWLNAIISVRTNTWNAHATMKGNALWSDGTNIYSNAKQIHVTSEAATAGPWSGQVKKDINQIFDIQVILPIIDDTPPEVRFNPNSGSWVKSRTVTISAKDAGVGVKNFRTRQRKDGGSWSGWSGYTTSNKTITFDDTGKHEIQVEARDNKDNVTTETSGVYEVDSTPPEHVGVNVNRSRYSENGKFWYRPGDPIEVDLSGYDKHAMMRLTYLRLSGLNNNNDNRGMHIWTEPNERAVDEITKGTYTEITSGLRDASGWTTRYKFFGKIKPNAAGQSFDVQYYYGDQAYNTVGYASTNQQIHVDGTAPSGTISKSTSSWINAGVTLTFKGTDTDSGVQRVKSPDGRWTYGDSTSYVATSNGSYTFTVEDNVGYTRDVSVSVTNVDTSDPRISAYAPSSWTRGSIPITVSATDDGSGLKRIRKPDGQWHYGPDLVYPVTQNGTYTFTAEDNAGNTTSTSVRVDTIDNSLPNGVIYGNPTSWTNQNATLTFQGTDTGSGVRRVKTPNGTWVNGDATSYTVSSNGTYTFEVEDYAGNSRSVSATVTRIDKSSPSGSVSGNPSAWTNNNVSLTLNGTDSGSGVKRIRLPNGQWTNATSTTYTVSSNGTYTFEVEDHAGNSSTVSTTVNRIDKGLPNGSISGNPTSWTNQNATLTFSGSDSESGVKRVKRPDGTWVNASSTSYSVSSNGTYTFEVEDHAGNTRSVSQTVTRIDKSNPYGSISGNPTSWTNQNATLTFDATDANAGIKRVKSPDGTWANGSRISYTATTNGTYTFQAEDHAGNLGNVSVSVTRIDKSTPSGAISGNPTSWTNQDATLTFTGTDSGGAGVKRVQTPNGTWVNGATATYTATANGTYTFTVEDHAGNIGRVGVGVSRIDKSNPAGTISGNPTSWTNQNATLTFTGTDSGGAGVKRVQAPNGVWTNGDKAVYTASANGTYTFKVEDHAGNTTDVSVSVTRIDKSNPAGTITGNPSSWTNGNATLTFTGTDSGGAGVKRVQAPNGTWVNGATATYTATANGTYTFKVEDHAGNTTDVSVSVTRIDKSNPSGTISGNPTSWTNQNATLTFTGTDSGGAGVKRVKAPNGVWTNGATATYTATSNGTYTFTVEDHAGNTTDVSVTVSRIDKTGPTGTISGNPSNWTNQDATLTFTGTDSGGAGVKRVQAPNGVWTNGAAITYTVSANGTYTFKVEDYAGNTTSVSVTVTRIDKTLPSLSASASPTKWTNQPVAITVSGSDSDSGIQSIEDVTTDSIVGRNFVQNSQLDFKVATVAWDEALNGNQVPTHGWSYGYNGGVTNPTVGYHAHIDTRAFGFPVMAYPNRNSTYGQTNRWLGMSQAFAANSLLGKELKVGTKVTVSYDLYSDKVGGEIYGGLYRKNTKSGAYQFPGQGATKANKAKTWERVSFVQTVDADWDLTSSFSLYLYGSKSDAEATKYVKNVKVELGDHATPHTVAPEDTTITGNKKVFEVSENGTYTYRATDNAGNTKDTSITITNIDTRKPTLSLRASTTNWTNQPVTIHASVSDTQSGIEKVAQVSALQVGQNLIKKSQPNETSSSYGFASSDLSVELEANKTYTFTFNGRIDQQGLNDGKQLRAYVYEAQWKSAASAPITTTSDSTYTMTYTPSVSGVHRVSAYLYPNGGSREGKVTLNWWKLEEGTPFQDYSSNPMTEMALKNNQAQTDVTTNGTYTFQATDVAGNETLEDITISNIDPIAPNGTVSGNPTDWTNKAITLKLSATDAGGSGVAYILDHEGKKTLGAVSTYTVTKNGTYTFTVVDHAGNRTDIQTTVSKIDTGNPSGTISGNPTSWTNQNATLTFTGTDTGGAGVKRVQAPNGTWVAGNKATYTATQNGTYTFKVEDHAGNVTDVSVIVNRIDKTNPAGTISGNPTSWTNQNAILAFNATDAGGSNVKRVQAPNGTWVNGDKATYTATANGTYTFKVEDHAGNVTDVSVSVTRIDKTNPAGTITGNPTIWTNGNATLTFTGTDSGGSNVKRVKAPNGTWTNGSTATYTATSNGTYTFTVEDHAGNTTDVSVSVTRIDKTNPAGTITGNPSNWTNQNATLVLNATDAGGSNVKRVQAPNGTWTNGATATYTATANGTYTFTVEDHAGNTTNVSVTVNRIDKTNPAGTISGNPTSWTNQNAILAFNATDAGGSNVKRVQAPNGTWVNGDKATYTATANGTYTFKVEDHAGNTTDVSVTVNRIDKTGPSGTFSGNPSNWTNQDVTVTFTGTDTGGSGVKRVQAPNGTWVNDSKTTLTVTQNGTYTFKVEDHAGNVTDVSVTVNRIDKVRPSGTITGSPTNWTNQEATLLFKGTDAGGSDVKRVKLPNGTWVNGATASYKTAQNGTYTFTVEDHAGNTTPISVTVTHFDTILPEGVITGNPTEWTNQNVLLTFQATDGESGVKRVQAPTGTWVTGAKVTYTATANGTYTFTVEDHAGNQRAVSVTVNRIDKQAPTGTISGNPTNWTNQDVTLVFSAIDAGGSEVKRVQTPSGSWVAGATASQVVTTNGSYTFRVEDGAGNVTTVTETVNKIDKVIPTHRDATVTGARYVNGKDHWFRPGDSLQVAITGSDADSKMKYSYLRFAGDGNDNRAYHDWDGTSEHVTEFQQTSGFTRITGGIASGTADTPTFTFDAHIAAQAGTKTFQVQSYFRDKASNVVGYIDSGYRVKTDDTKPVITASSATREWGNTPVTVVLKHSDADAGLATQQYAWSNTTTTPTAWKDGTGTMTQGDTGTWYLHARAVDNVGNETVTHFGPYRIDTIRPGGVITGNPLAWTNQNVTLAFNASDLGGSGVKRIRQPNGTWVSGATASEVVQTNGTYTFTVEDHAGNTTTVSVIVNRIDKTKPDGTITGNPTNWTNQDVTLTFRATDAGGAGIKRVRRPNGTWVTGSETTQTVAANGTYTFRSEDHAGNTTDTTVTVTRIDKQAPSQSIITIAHAPNLLSDQYPDWTDGYHYSQTTGQLTAYANRIALKKLVKVKPNTTYFFKSGSDDAHFVIRAYSGNATNQMVRSIGGIGSGGTFTTGPTEQYLGVALYNTSGYKNQFETGAIKPELKLYIADQAKP